MHAEGDVQRSRPGKYINGPVLVIGGCGFLGHHIVNDLFTNVSGGLSIAIADLNTNTNRHPQATYHKIDITRCDDVAKVFEIVKPQVVFHTVSPSSFERKHSVLERVNILGTQNLIECAKAVGTVRAFIYTSSSSLVHNYRDPMIEAREDLPVLYYPEQPQFYSHTKALGEKIVLSANRENGMLTASIRPATLYGPGDALITPNLTRQALTGRAKYQFGKGAHLFDTVYVENCTNAQILAANALVRDASSPPKPENIRVEGEAFNITNDEHIPFWDLQRLVAEVVGFPVKPEDIRRIPVLVMMMVAVVAQWLYWVFSLGKKQPVLTTWVVRVTTMERTLNITKAKERLGYKPKFTNREGWEKGVKWALADLETRTLARAKTTKK